MVHLVLRYDGDIELSVTKMTTMIEAKPSDALGNMKQSAITYRLLLSKRPLKKLVYMYL